MNIYDLTKCRKLGSNGKFDIVLMPKHRNRSVMKKFTLENPDKACKKEQS